MNFSALRLRAVRTVRKYFRRELDEEALINLDEVAPFIRRHLKQLYLTLIFATASSAFGSYLSCSGYIGSSLSAFGAFTSIVWFYYVPPWKENKRAFILTLGAFFGGASFAPWFTWFFGVDTNFVVASILATSVGFGCLWAASKWAKSFELVYFTAMLLYIPLLLICLLFEAAVFHGNLTIWKFNLYVSLLWGMMYAVVYSQEVVVKARKGDDDYVKHAITLFIDFPPVSVIAVKMMIKLVITEIFFARPE